MQVETIEVFNPTTHIQATLSDMCKLVATYPRLNTLRLSCIFSLESEKLEVVKILGASSTLTRLNLAGETDYER